MADVSVGQRQSREASSFVRWLLRRLAHSLPTVIGVIVLDFFLLQLVPGDYAEYNAATSGVATAETMQAMRQYMGLDHSLPMQFWHYLTGLVQGNLGVSRLYGGAPVVGVIFSRLPLTLVLVITTLAVSLVIGTVLGAVSAANADRPVGKLITSAIVFIYSVPSFLKGLFLIIIFSVILNWLPSNGYGTIGVYLSFGGWLLDRGSHLVLPVLTLSLFYIAVYARIVSTSMLDVRKQNYVRTALAKGLYDRQINLRHILRNALMPLTTVAGIHVGMILSGAVIVETVFAWPGIGSLTYDALFARDFQLVLGILLMTSFMVIISNILVDLIQMLIDPRIRE